MKFVTIAAAGLAIGLFGAAACLTAARKPHLQARIYSRISQEGLSIWDLQKLCPDRAVGSMDQKADYVLLGHWGDKGWTAYLVRTDHAMWELEESPDGGWRSL